MRIYLWGGTEDLADSAGVELPKMEYSGEAKESRLKSALLEINKEAASIYYYQLRQKPENRGWISDRQRTQ